MIHADLAFGRLLEGLICAEWRRLAEIAGRALPAVAAECIDVAGGVALWLGEGSPVNLAVGLGMNRPVDEAELARLETFYHERGAEAVITLCPLADQSLLTALGRRGWRATEFEHVLVLELTGAAAAGGVAVGIAEADVATAAGANIRLAGCAAGSPVPEMRVCSPGERETWAGVAPLGFSDGGPPGRGHDEFGRIMAAREDAILVLARVDGEPAGTGCLVIDGGVGWLSGDSTLPQYRRLGIQQAIQRHRLQLARDAGCDLAVTEAAPGGASQRNMERLGFRIAYTHVEFVKD